MRILLVDDEPNVVSGLRRMLIQNEDWSVVGTHSGDEALEILEKSQMDVIISDVRMPGMNGIQFLEKVHQQYPSIARVILSGFSELELASRAATVTHQYLRKPSSSEEVIEVIESACNLQSHLNLAQTLLSVREIDYLPPAPTIYLKLNELLSSDDASVKDVAAILSEDPGLSAKVLQMVNSAFFGLPVQITDVQKAVSRLGFNTVSGLVLSTKVVEAFDNVGSNFSWDTYQRESIFTAQLAEKFLPNKEQASVAYTAGLLHNIGKLIQVSKMSDRHNEVLAEMQKSDDPDHVIEKRLFGVTHAELGGCLLSLWGLPYDVVAAVTYHHKPRNANRKLNPISAVNIANQIVLGHDVDAELLQKHDILKAVKAWEKKAA
ncbi:MAG: HDOD domain-containing protein [Candidatus Eisenbacteria bacterium]|uniref:HDOD domain-containing protein n=1 Tax=Eiseniibacteriota bacterium TaxID=2212470 RepID=A0A7Y2ED25_UNCEI|nr:HDOD domain-containing protein [Candidatus Eisenbacteria bacterium]